MAPEIVCVEELVVDFALPLPVTKVATVFYAYDEGCDDTGIYGDGYFAHFDDALWATARTYANEEYGLYRTPPKPLTWRKHHHLWRLHDGDSPTDIVVSDSPLLGSAPSTGAAPDEQPQDERDGDAPTPTVEYGALDDSTRSLIAAATSHVAVNEVSADFPDDEDHRGDDATDCPACSAVRHQAQQDGDVRAVAATLTWIRAEIAPERKLLGAVFSGAWTDLEDRFMDRIAELDARDAKAGS